MTRRCRLSIVALVVLLIGAVPGSAQEMAQDGFDGTGPLPASTWVADNAFVQQSSNLHNSNSTAEWDFAVFKTAFSANKVTIRWTESPAATSAGIQTGGVLLASSASLSTNGYFIYFRNGSYRLYSAVGGVLQDKLAEQSSYVVPGPGDAMTVEFSNGSFVVSIEGTQAVTLSPSSTPYTIQYGGVVMLGNNANDISAIRVENTGTGGGGGGGGDDPPTPPPGEDNYSQVIDPFDSRDDNAWAYDPSQSVSGGELKVNDGENGSWSYLAAYKSAGAGGLAVTFSPNSFTLVSNTVPMGLALFLDSPSSDANGYVIYRKNDDVRLYGVSNGDLATGILEDSASPSQPLPSAGSTMRAMIRDNGDGSYRIELYIDGSLDATLTLNNPAVSLENAYVGVLQYARSGVFGDNISNLDNFTAYIPTSGNPSNVDVVAGNNQSGDIRTTLPDTLKVQVTNEEGMPLSGVTVDFSISEPADHDHTLSVNEYEWDGLVWEEAESASILGRARAYDDDPDASGGFYVMTPYEAGQRGDEVVRLSFYAPEAGNYVFLMRYKAESDNKDGFYYSVDGTQSWQEEGGAWASPNGSFPVQSSFNSWYQIPQSYDLDKGQHTLHLYVYEPGWAVDKFAVVNRNIAGNYRPPNGSQGGTGPVFPNMTNNDGVAFTTVTFGNTAGRVKVEATTTDDDGIALEPAVFDLYAIPGEAVTLYQNPEDENLPGFLGSTMPLQVIAQDQYGNGVPNIQVNWQVMQGSGATLSNQTSLTDTSGTAVTQVTLGYIDTEYVVNASAPGLQGSPRSFTITVGSIPDRIELTGGNNQEYQAGEPLPESVRVRVVKADGTGFPQFPVQFRITQGGGSFRSLNGSLQGSEISVSTDADGYAFANWILGKDVGFNKAEVVAPGVSGSPIQLSATGVLGPAERFVMVSGDTQTGYLGLPLSEPFVVKVTDKHGNAIVGYDVHFELLQGDEAYLDQEPLTERNKKTDGNGEAETTLIMGTTPQQTHKVRATAQGLTPDSLIFQASLSNEVVASELEYISGRDQSGPVTSTLTQPFVVRVKSPIAGQYVANHPVTFNVVEGGGNFGGSDNVTVYSDDQGYAQATLNLGNVAGVDSQVVEARSYYINNSEQQLTNSPVVFKATSNPGPAANLVKYALSDSQSAEVGKQLLQPIKARVTDIHGNPIEDYFVTYEVKSAGGTLVDQEGESPFKTLQTGKDGYAVVTWKMPTLPGTWRLEATATKEGGLFLNGSPMTFTATSIVTDAGNMISLVEADTLVGVVAQTLDEHIRVKITDSYGNPVPDYPVLIRISEGGGTVNGQPQVQVKTSTDSGIVDVEWTLGNKSGTANNLLEAHAGIDNGTVLVFKATARPDEPNRLVEDRAVNYQVGQVGATLDKAIRVQIVDQYGNGVPELPVTFFVMGEDSVKGNLSGQPEQEILTDDEGYAEVEWTLGKVPGSKNNSLRVSAKYNNENLINSPFTYYASATIGDPFKIVALTDTDEPGRIGNSYPEDLKVKVTDPFDNPIAGHDVIFTVQSTEEANGGSLDGTATVEKTKKTDSNGVVGVTFTLGQRAGESINHVTAASEFESVALNGSPVHFRISAIATNADAIALWDGDEQTGTVGHVLPDELKIRVVDSFGNPVNQPHPVQFRVIAGKGFLGAIDDSMRTVTVNSENGIASVAWTLGTEAGNNNNVVEATSSNGPKSLGTLSFSARALPDITDPHRSMVQAYPVTPIKVSEGTTTANIVVTLMDQYENVIPDKAVILKQPTGQNLILENPSSLSDANGMVTGTVASTRAGEMKVWAYDMNNRVEIVDTATVVFEPLDAQNISAAPTDNGDQQVGNIGTVLPKPLRVVVKDRFGNPIEGFQVEWIVTQGGQAENLIDGRYTLTDSMGIASNRYRLGTNSELPYNRIEVRASGLVGSPVRFTENALSPLPSKLVVVSGDSQRAAAGEQLPDPLTVKLVDAGGKEIYGLNVAFEPLVNNGRIISGNPVRTNMYGQASANVTVGTQKGLNLFRAYLPNYPAIKSVTFTTYTDVPSSAASKLQYVDGGGQRDVVARTLSRPLVVSTEDDYGNPVPGVPVVFTVVNDGTVDGSGSFAGGQTSYSTTSNDQGLATCYYTLGTSSGTNKVNASSPNLVPKSVTFELYSSPDVPYTMEMHTGNLQRMEKGKFLLDPIIVMVRDQYGNPAPYGPVYFTVLQGGGEIMPKQQPILSDQNGRAEAQWRLGETAVANQVIATANLPGRPEPVYFSATGDENHYPYFVDLPDQIEINENQQFCLTVNPRDDDGDQMFISASNLPEGAEFNTNTMTFCWTPDYTQAGVHMPIFTVEDNPGGKGVDTVRVMVRDVPRPPVISSFSPSESYMKVKWGQQYDFSVDAHDPDGEQVFYQWMVDGNSVNVSGNTFSLDTRFYPFGVHTITVVIYDLDDAQTSKSWSFNVVTAVELSSFTSTTSTYDGAILDWETSSERGNAGFNILRSTSEHGSYTKINSELIPSDPSRTYSFTDTTIVAGRKVYYKLEDVSVSGNRSTHGPVVAEIPLPREYGLSQNYPNPFNPTTSIRYQLPKPGKVTLEVYNIYGQLVQTLVDQVKEAGFHTIEWNGRDERGLQVSSGVYYYRVLVDGFTTTKKMALIK